MAGQVTLTGPRVTLRPLERSDRDALVDAATDGELWTLRVTSVPSAETIDAWIERALAGRDAGTMLPYTTLVGDEVVGSTRFWRLDRQNRTVEIGHTWIARRWQRSFVNTEAKLLMLRYAFDDLAMVRVQFMTDALNARSRAAILRLGATEEGLLRKERIMWDGRMRDSVVFSIIDDDWPTVRVKLEAGLGRDRD
jgi:RimJ/RimL family protein N-acetyltransferase